MTFKSKITISGPKGHVTRIVDEFCLAPKERSLLGHFIPKPKGFSKLPLKKQSVWFDNNWDGQKGITKFSNCKIKRRNAYTAEITVESKEDLRALYKKVGRKWNTSNIHIFYYRTGAQGCMGFFSYMCGRDPYCAHKDNFLDSYKDEYESANLVSYFPRRERGEYE